VLKKKKKFVAYIKHH